MSGPTLYRFAIWLTLSSILVSTPQVRALKIDCHPLNGATKEKCEALGCTWSPVHKSHSSVSHTELKNFEPPARLPHESINDGLAIRESRVDEPWCYYPDKYVGYKILSTTQTEIRLRRVRPSALGEDDIKNIVVKTEAYNEGNLLRIRLLDADHKRFEPELPHLNLRPAPSESTNETSSWSSDFKVELETLDHEQGGTQQSPQVLTIKRVSTNAVIFSSDLTKLIYSDKFMQLDSQLASPFVYGLGEHYDNFLKFADTYKTFSFYNTDRLTLPGGTRSYGGFPFYVNFDSPNNIKAHGVYLRNSNALDVVIKKELSVSFRPIGGILDFFLFVGPTPLDVARQFQDLVGKPQLPPRWSLGFHLCRYDYKSLNKTRLVWQRTRDAGIPFDVQWNDIDYMERGNDFTYDKLAYAQLPEFVDELHANHMHYVLIFDPGLSQEANYYPYELGDRLNIFVRNATNHKLVGKVWNQSGRTVFPDFSHPATTDFWSKLFVRFQRLVKFDGAWIDMNDISNFVDGSLDGCPISAWPVERPPYLPGGYSLQTKSLCLSARHWAGVEYDLHNLYSFYEARATHAALEAARPQRRPFIISRSTHPGQGHYGGHWSGDVASTWGYLRWSIPSLLEHSLYGYSMIGTDICGFIGNTTPELCARWSTLGAFYTFSRNHNDEKSIDQDPVALGPLVVSANKNAQTKRYSLLPYLYTLIHKAHLDGEPVARSMAFEFFEHHEVDQAAKAEDQFMWGSAVLLSPIVEENTYTKSTYLPAGRWYEFDITPESMSFDASLAQVPKVVDAPSGNATIQWHQTDAIELDNMPIFYRGGHIVPVYPEVRPTIPQTVEQPIGLEVALCQMERAQGLLILDDGDTIDGPTNYIKFDSRNGELVIDMVRDEYSKRVQFGSVKIYGIAKQVTKVELAGRQLEFTQKEHMLMFTMAGAEVAAEKPISVSWS